MHAYERQLRILRAEAGAKARRARRRAGQAQWGEEEDGYLSWDGNDTRWAAGGWVLDPYSEVTPRTLWDALLTATAGAWEGGRGARGEPDILHVQKAARDLAVWVHGQDWDATPWDGTFLQRLAAAGAVHAWVAFIQVLVATEVPPVLLLRSEAAGAADAALHCALVQLPDAERTMDALWRVHHVFETRNRPECLAWRVAGAALRRQDGAALRAWLRLPAAVGGGGGGVEHTLAPLLRDALEGGECGTLRFALRAAPAAVCAALRATHTPGAWLAPWAAAAAQALSPPRAVEPWMAPDPDPQGRGDLEGRLSPLQRALYKGARVGVARELLAIPALRANFAPHWAALAAPAAVLAARLPPLVAPAPDAPKAGLQQAGGDAVVAAGWAAVDLAGRGAVAYKDAQWTPSALRPGRRAAVLSRAQRLKAAAEAAAAAAPATRRSRRRRAGR